MFCIDDGKIESVTEVKIATNSDNDASQHDAQQVDDAVSKSTEISTCGAQYEDVQDDSDCLDSTNFDQYEDKGVDKDDRESPGKKQSIQNIN